MSEKTEKIPFKQAELSAKKFNEVAIPYHLGLLKNHKSNIEKCLALGDWTKIKKEEINAMRAVKQLKNLLLEMDYLREKVKDEDLNQFDELISIGKSKAMDGMKDYMELQLKSPTSTITSMDDTSPITLDNETSLPKIQTEYSMNQLLVRQACLDEFENLQREVEDLHGMFQNVSELVNDHAECVTAIADNAEEALENVEQGENNLRRALTYRKAMYPVVGAFLGTCVGGPIGLLAGMKAGGLAAIGCGILGFTGGSVLKQDENIFNGTRNDEKKDE